MVSNLAKFSPTTPPCQMIGLPINETWQVWEKDKDDSLSSSRPPPPTPSSRLWSVNTLLSFHNKYWRPYFYCFLAEPCILDYFVSVCLREFHFSRAKLISSHTITPFLFSLSREFVVVVNDAIPFFFLPHVPYFLLFSFPLFLSLFSILLLLNVQTPYEHSCFLSVGWLVVGWSVCHNIKGRQVTALYTYRGTCFPPHLPSSRCDGKGWFSRINFLRPPSISHKTVG